MSASGDSEMPVCCGNENAWKGISCAGRGSRKGRELTRCSRPQQRALAASHNGPTRSVTLPARRGTTRSATRANCRGRAPGITGATHEALPQAELFRELQAHELAAGVAAGIRLVELREPRQEAARQGGAVMGTRGAERKVCSESLRACRCCRLLAGCKEGAYVPALLTAAERKA